MNARELNRLRKELASFMGAVAGDFQRKGRDVWGERYVRGLLLDGERKSIEPLADRIRKIDGGKADYTQSLQQFISQSTWDYARVRNGLSAHIAEQLGAEGFLIVDDTGFPKWGEHSVGVTRQYSGTLGKVDNCQVATTLQFARNDTVVALDAELYLPDRWTNDSKRLRAAGVPEKVEFRRKWQLALEMIERARVHGFTGVVLSDAAYGDVTRFRESLTRAGLLYAVAVSGSLKVIDAKTKLGQVPAYKGTGRRPSRPRKVRARAKSPSVKEWSLDHLDDFRRVSWGRGTKGKLQARFAAWRVRPAHRLSAGRKPLAPLWLLAEWCNGEEEPTKFYFATLDETTSLRKLIITVKARWLVEQSYRELKDELGLDHFEGRCWNGWHRHVTLVFMAYAFLQLYRRREEKRGAVPN